MILKTTYMKFLLAGIMLASMSAVFAQPAPSLLGHRESGQEALAKPTVLTQVAGRWTVTFSNGVVETCEISQSGTTTVDEPQRSSLGKARIREGDLMLYFEDDRIERWTRVGSQMVVEHWCPTAAFASERPVLGIAVHSGE